MYWNPHIVIWGSMTDLTTYLFDVDTASSDIICIPPESGGFLILSLQDSIWHEWKRWSEMIRLLSDPSRFFPYNFRSVSGRRDSDEIRSSYVSFYRNPTYSDQIRWWIRSEQTESVARNLRPGDTQILIECYRNLVKIIHKGRALFSLS